MKQILLLILLITISTFEIHSQSHGIIRFDGLYQTETLHHKETVDTFAFRHFLRFYTDGTVISESSTSEAKDLISLLTKEENNGKGKYEIKNNAIYFTTSSNNGVVVYEGTIVSEYKMVVNVKSLINGHESEKIYYFIKL